MCQSHTAVRAERNDLLHQHAKASSYESPFSHFSAPSLAGGPDELEERTSGTDGDSLLADETTSSSSLGETTSEELGGSRDVVLEFLSSHGLAACSLQRLLGTGATCRVEAVAVPLPEGDREGGPYCLAAARKTLPRSPDPHLRAREDAAFAREVAGLRASGSSPFVVRLLGTCCHPDRHELLMELAEGGTLEGELTDALGALRGPPSQPLLPSDRIAQVAASVLSALVALHARGVAHLDVKPANILRTGEGRLMLADFGCAQRVAAAPTAPPLLPACGTPLFAAPETKRRGAAFGPPADLYSVGVLLAVCAAWHRQTGRVLALLRGEAAGRLPDWVPAPLRELVGALTVEDPGRRPSAAEALRHPFLAGMQLGALAPVRGRGHYTVPR